VDISERSDSRAPCNADELEMDVNVLGTSKPQSQSSHPQVLHAGGNPIVDEDESLSQIPAEVPGVLAPQSQDSNLQAHSPTANEKTPAPKIAVNPEPSKSNPQHSDSQVSPANDTQPTNEDDNSGKCKLTLRRR
jgi:hypothetical protein